ncbi:lipoprotein [Mycoplasma mycoides subsp. capri]|uniref:lipoprotein n=1 Tax=Mycoplasma mycoides TaxID=2102 RepID=UPI002240BE35|nr:lipoprotein [Mycoplasma mycoides]QVJ95913.1 lipoprotein [Mycoplasma mycoides subsp. capri]QVJ96803.1 lipoprotein [Mycoplasma mycoides subsp. capri]QVJ99844.1 lipoprotein [Mycoplasma mycoides subsp. capri]QVK00666.1 lipoprotein [Mycoplasma mycoides subsp. capri]
MKKLITILSSFGLVITTGTTAVACKNNQPSSLKPTAEDQNTSLTSNPNNNGSESTDSIQNKEEVTKIKEQLEKLGQSEQKAKQLLGQIEEGNKKATEVSNNEQIKSELEKLNAQKPEIEKVLKQIEEAKKELETRLKTLEDNN